MRRFNRDQEVNQSLMTMLLNHEETVRGRRGGGECDEGLGFNRHQEVNQSLMTMLLNHEETVRGRRGGECDEGLGFNRHQEVNHEEKVGRGGGSGGFSKRV